LLRDCAGPVHVIFQTRNAKTITVVELYALLRLRTDVFEVEQACPYPELDGLLEGTLHAGAHDNGDLGGAIRVLDVDGSAPSIGRAATAPVACGRGVSSQLLQHGIELCRLDATIQLNTQAPLESWYEQFGLPRNGDPYDEDGIPHIPIKETPPRS
jgi:ElaA protein